MDIPSLWYSFVAAVKDAEIRDILDILVVAFLIYEVILLVRQTHTAQLAKGVLVLIGAFFIADLASMRTLRYIIRSVMNFGLIAVVVVFQPELRRALEQVGHTSAWSKSIFKDKTNVGDLRTRLKMAAVTVCDAVERLAESSTGALIVFERNSNLSDVVKTGTVLSADITSEILGTIFYEGTPLHDGAVVVRDGRIEAAGCVLPLSDNLEIGKDMGTRHRAALGMSENSDAVIVVVSEETGIISLAKNGVLIRRLDRQNLFNLLEGDVVPPLPEDKKQPVWAFWRKKHETGQDKTTGE